MRSLYIRLMGGERSSTTRQREAGKICCKCHSLLHPPHPGRERYCDRCGPTRRVFMTFFARGGPGIHDETWVVSFLEADLRTPIGRIRKFGSADKLRELIARTPTRFDLAGKQALEVAFSGGRGGVYLELSQDQYQKLRTFDKG